MGVAQPAGLLLYRRKRRRRRGVPGPPRRTVLPQPRRRLVDRAEGSTGPGRGPARRGAAGVRRGDRAGAVPWVPSSISAPCARRAARSSTPGRPRATAIPPLRSNTFGLEWPPRSGKTSEFPEIDRGEFFTLERRAARSWRSRRRARAARESGLSSGPIAVPIRRRASPVRRRAASIVPRLRPGRH